jgi:predicted dehydrogenase
MKAKSSCERYKRFARRDFLRSAALTASALALPAILPARVLGKDADVAPPSGRITLGAIGIGGMGTLDLTSLLGQSDVQVLAVCDVKEKNLQRAAEMVNRQYQNQDCARYHDWRELMARSDLDAIYCATPDHWHAIISIAAAQAGKDIYCQKPLGVTIAEGRAIADAVKRSGIVYQSGTQRRSQPNNRFCVETARSGRIGKLLYIVNRMGDSPGPQSPKITPAPPDIDYDMWLGPSPAQPYSEVRVSGAFRHISDYAGGSMTDMGAHYNDIAQMVRPSYLDAPVTFQVKKARFHEHGIFDTAWGYEVIATYEDGLEIRMLEGDKGMRWVGTEGWVDLADEGQITSHPASLLEDVKVNTHWSVVAGHHRNWLDCVKTRSRPVADAEVAHRSTTLSHAANIAMRLGRDLRWDRHAERFVNDDAANNMIARAIRAPWTL